MAWTEIKHTKGEVDRAGLKLISSVYNSKEVDQALNVLDNWRSAHSFPLHIFKKRLKEVSVKTDPTAFVVQRLKRTPAIVKKLQREQNLHMRLSDMQDIGGCRSVVSNVDLVKKICTEYYHTERSLRGKHCDLKHHFKNKKDYISNPKNDGYRSVHLIYKYNSDKTTKYNGLLIEIQVRSRLQHFWATAVETVGHFTKQALKSNEGEEDWKNFFKLISSVFAKMEGTPGVPGTPADDSELFQKVKELNNKLQVVSKIRTWTRLVNLLENINKQTSQFYLLELDIDSKDLNILSFGKNEEEKANTAYIEAERNARLKKLNKDIVLVEAETTMELKKAYPNYFLDTREFLSILDNYLKRNNKI